MRDIIRCPAAEGMRCSNYHEAKKLYSGAEDTVSVKAIEPREEAAEAGTECLRVVCDRDERQACCGSGTLLMGPPIISLM